MFTSHQKVLKDVLKVFNFLEVNYKIKKYKHLIVSPHYTFSALIRLIDNEIENKKAGKNARIRLKLNNITNYKIIDKLYEASRAGVAVDMIVRGICCLVPGVKGMRKHRVISVVDKFLPQSIFLKMLGSQNVYLFSRLMTRNLQPRWRLAPFTTKIYQELLDTFD